jgi:TolB-like protein
LKTRFYTLNRNILLTATALLLFFTTAPALAAPSRVAILPFDMHAEKDLTFLQEGILDMLGSRLAWKDKVEVINENETRTVLESIEGFDGESRALLAGGKLKADYVLFGSLTVFGESVSIDARMVDVSGQQEPLPFFAQTRGMGEVIPKINEFATNINATVFGRQVAQRPAAAPAAQAGPPASAPQVQQPYNSRMHPEKLLQSGIPGDQQPRANRQDSYAITPGEIWRGPFIHKAIDSLAVEDIDQDGRNEILVLAEKTISIYRREGGRLVPVLESGIETINVRCLFIDTIDLDNDGQKEICVTGVNEKQLLAASFIYRIENMRLSQMLGPVNYLLRVVDTADGPALLGQTTRRDNSGKLKTPVVELKLGPGAASLVPGGMTFPFADNVFGIAFGDFLNNGTEAIAVLDLGGVISLYTREGKLIHKGNDEYGGSKAYIEYKGMRYNKDDGLQLSRLFFQQRLLPATFGDGKNGLIAVNNVDSTQGFLSKTRIYRKSRIDVLLWNELGLVVLERGQTLSGYISDLAIADTNMDGSDEVVFSLVSPTNVLKSPRSQIYSKQLQ